MLQGQIIPKERALYFSAHEGIAIGMHSNTSYSFLPLQISWLSDNISCNGCLFWSVPNQLKYASMVVWMIGGHILFQENYPFARQGSINTALSLALFVCCDLLLAYVWVLVNIHAGVLTVSREATLVYSPKGILMNPCNPHYTGVIYISGA